MKDIKETMPLQAHERLSAISKEHHSRKNLIYIAEDKLKGFVICSQRLSDLVCQINSIVGPDKPDQVSVTGLYQIISCQEGGRCGGWTKHRWRVRSVDLTDGERAADVFEDVRQRGFSNTLIVGVRDAYTIACT